MSAIAPPATTDATASTRPAVVRALVLAGLLAVLFVAVLWPKIAAGTLWFHDELLSGNRAREMILRHDPFTVTINFKPDFKKPPLQYWVSAAFLSIFKNRELAIRLPSLLYGALCLPAAVFLAWATRRAKPAPGTFSLLMPAVAIAVFGSFVHYSRIGILDTGAAFYLTLAVAGCQLARGNPRWWWFVALVCWLGAWQKAPYALAAWALLLAVRRVRAPEETDFRSRHLWGAFAASVAMSAAWFALQFFRHGNDIILDAGHEQANALLRAHDPDGAGFQPYLYWWWLMRDWAVIGLLTPIAVVATLVWSWRRKHNDPLLEAAAVCAAFGLVLSLTPFRVERYLVTVVPLLAVVTLGWAADLLERRGFSAWTRRGVLALLVVVAIPVACFHYSKPPRGGPAELLAAAHDLRGRLQSDQTVVIDRNADPDFNTYCFIVFYGHLHRPAKLLKIDGIEKLLSTVATGGSPPVYCGIERLDALPRLQRANANVQVASRHGEWVLWTCGAAARTDLRP